MSKKKEILIAKVFCGGYLHDGENIGHEVIDFFDADNGERYLYIASNGKVNKHPNVEAVLLIRAYSNKLGEVVGLAYDLEDVQSPQNKKELSSVTYGGVLASKIFARNVYKGEKEEAFSNFTYRARSFKALKSECQIFITMGSDEGKDKERHPIELNCGEKKQWGHQRTYVSSVDHPEAYKQLKALMADEEKWEKQAGTISKKLASGDTSKSSFLEIIGKEDDELVFSNLLAHYLRRSKEGFRAFAKEVLGIDDFGSQLLIVRESKHHVDLWIESERYIVVIENKIHSAINGVKLDRAETQLSNYRKAAEGDCKGRAVECYVFAPYVNNVDEDKVKAAGYHKIVLYNTLHTFFSNNEDLFKDEYYGEFLAGLQRHTLPSAQRNEQEMLRRFSCMIDKAESDFATAFESAARDVEAR